MLPPLTLVCNINDKILMKPGILVYASNIKIGDLICFDDKLDLSVNDYAHYKLFLRVKSAKIENDKIIFNTYNI